MSESLSQHHCDVSSVNEWDTLQDNVKESKDMQEHEYGKCGQEAKI